jgi:hypothetical protein
VPRGFGNDGELFTADIPTYVRKEKYHPSFNAMLALQKYYMAMPFHRKETLKPFQAESNHTYAFSQLKLYAAY